MMEMSSTYQHVSGVDGNTTSVVGKSKVYVRQFSGSDLDRAGVDDWIADYERKAHQLKWPEVDMLQNFPNFLIESAKDWFDVNADDRIETRPRTWSELKELFLQCFKVHDPYDHILSQVLECRQRHEEPPSSFINRINKLCHKINMPIEERFSHIKRGLHPKLREAVKHATNITSLNGKNGRYVG